MERGRCERVESRDGAAIGYAEGLDRQSHAARQCLLFDLDGNFPPEDQAAEPALHSHESLNAGLADQGAGSPAEGGGTDRFKRR